MKTKTTSNHWEVPSKDVGAVADLRKLIAQGEGLQLEFKKKAAHPDKLVREIIAFANTDGGTLLIGVDDDGTLSGVKYPEEELHVLQQALATHCRPFVVYNAEAIPLNENRHIVRIDIPPSTRRPHRFMLDHERFECLVRHEDKTIKASREVIEIIQRSKKKKDIRFTFGDDEKSLMVYLEEHQTITLQQFRKLSRLNRFRASRKLILLVLANVLKVQPTEKGDLYQRA